MNVSSDVHNVKEFTGSDFYEKAIENGKLWKSARTHTQKKPSKGKRYNK